MSKQTSFSEADARQLQQQLLSGRGKLSDDLKLLKTRWSELKSVWHDKHRQTFEPQFEQLLSRWETVSRDIDTYQGSLKEQIKISASLTEINARLNRISAVAGSPGSSSFSHTATAPSTVSDSPGNSPNNSASAADTSHQADLDLGSDLGALTAQAQEMLGTSVKTLSQKGGTCLEIFLLVNGMIGGFSSLIPQIPQADIDLDSGSFSAVSDTQGDQCRPTDQPASTPDFELRRKMTNDVFGNIDAHLDMKDSRRKISHDNDTFNVTEQKGEDSGSADVP